MKKKCYSLDQTSECRYINNNLHLYSDSEILVNKQKIGVNLFIQSIWQITDCKSVKFSYPVSIFKKKIIQKRKSVIVAVPRYMNKVVIWRRREIESI